MTKEMHEVGCRKCGKGGYWKIFTDGKGHFQAHCKCGHISEFGVIEKGDYVAIEWEKPFDMRLIL